MSLSLARASEQTVLSLIIEAIVWIASKSPFELAAKPASMTSTFMRSSCFAMRIFSSFVIDAPGDCSPSRNVVSKMISLSDMSGLLGRRSDVGIGSGMRGLAPPLAQRGHVEHDRSRRRATTHKDENEAWWRRAVN